MPSVLFTELCRVQCIDVIKPRHKNTVSIYKLEHFVPILEIFREEVTKPEKFAHPIMINGQSIVQSTDY